MKAPPGAPLPTATQRALLASALGTLSSVDLTSSDANPTIDAARHEIADLLASMRKTDPKSFPPGFAEALSEVHWSLSTGAHQKGLDRLQEADASLVEYWSGRPGF